MAGREVPDWPCRAYGDDPAVTELGAWCFVAELFTRTCMDRLVCALEVNAAGQRIYRRISELAATGNPTSEYLAEIFTSPDVIFGGDSEP